MKIKVKNMTGSKGNAVPNQFIIEAGKFIYFQSYRTIIARIGNGKTVLDKEKWDCSRTTMKYLNHFLGHEAKETRRRIASGEYKLMSLN